MNTNSYITSAVATAITFLSVYIVTAETQNPWGAFSGNPRVELLSDREVRLLDDFIFTTSDGETWNCPKDWIVDGASIPKIFWSVIGGPLDGKYRNASIIHDYACDMKKRPWKSVHLAFYKGMRCGGVPEAKAKLMYWAVYNFGPRWGLGGFFTSKSSEDAAHLPKTEEDVRQMLQFIEESEPSLEKLQTIKFVPILE